MIYILAVVSTIVWIVIYAKADVIRVTRWWPVAWIAHLLLGPVMVISWIKALS